ncbi:MAG: hypothetical protein ACTHYO_10385 [Micrococcaceae bacterium]
MTTEIQGALNALPDNTLIEASGRYSYQKGTFERCWARPIPDHVTGREPGADRLWEVLVWGSEPLMNLVSPAHITSYRVLYTEGPEQS